MKTSTYQLIGIAVAIIAAIAYMAVVFSETIFGDLTKVDTAKPLFVIVPIVAIAAFIYWRWMKRN